MFDIISNFIISLIPFKTKSTGASTSLSALTLYITVASIIYFNKRKHYWLGKKIKVNPDKIEVKKFVPVMQNLNKEIETIKKEIVSDANIDKPENIEKTENIKTKKPAKYCSKCGSLIDENKKCTGCGKQYIKIKPMKILLPLIYLVLLVVIALLVVQSVDDKRKIHDLSTRYENYATRYSDLYDDFQELDTENSKNKELITSIRKVYDIVSTEAIEYENQVAIVTGADNYYHTINCQTIYEGEAINIYSVRGAEGLGYTSCPFCH